MVKVLALLIGQARLAYLGKGNLPWLKIILEFETLNSAFFMIDRLGEKQEAGYLEG